MTASIDLSEVRIPTPPPPHWSRAFLAMGMAAIVALHGCPPRPVPVDGGPSVTPSAWTDTARIVISTLRWALPAVRLVLAAVLPSDVATIVGRSIDALAEWTARLAESIDVYEQRGGDRCAAHAAVGGATNALVALTQVLADNGIALGRTLERVADSLGAVGDALAPACSLDAGWGSDGERINAQLRAIQARAVRGPNWLVLDNISPDAGH